MYCHFILLFKICTGLLQLLTNLRPTLGVKNDFYHLLCSLNTLVKLFSFVNGFRSKLTALFGSPSENTLSLLPRLLGNNRCFLCNEPSSLSNECCALCYQCWLLDDEHCALNNAGWLLNDEPSSLSNGCCALCYQCWLLDDEHCALNNAGWLLNDEPSSLNNEGCSLCNGCSLLDNEGWLLNDEPSSLNNQCSLLNAQPHPIIPQILAFGNNPLFLKLLILWREALDF